MTEHRGTSFMNSCVKMPVDPYSRQPTPSYERPRLTKGNGTEKGRKINFAKADHLISDSESSSPRDTVDNFLEFLESIPDYGQVHHLSNEQFRQKVEYLKRKQRLFLRNLKNTFEDTDKDTISKISTIRSESTNKGKQRDDISDLKLNGKKCYFEESRTNSPILYSSGMFAGLTEDQDLLTYRYKNKDKDKDKDKETKTMRNKEIHSANKSWSTWDDSKSDDSVESDVDDSIETKSLPPDSSKEWHPTVPKPFSFTLREEAEKYMTQIEAEAAERTNKENVKKSPSRKRRVRPIPLTSKIPLYDKLLAEKEERSRMIREESALNLMSQVRPFKLECDRRAWRTMARSSPELRGKSSTSLTFRAKPVPKNLFGTEVYDRMLEDEYFRQLKKKVRAAELMKSSSLPPSMARRERIESARTPLQDSTKNCTNETESGISSRLSNLTSAPTERSRSAMTILSSQGNNLASILRCKASREKLEREIREKMEEKRREQTVKIRESLIGRKPAWRALRSAARHDREKDFDMRTSLRRDEAREQAERHRLQMEMMLDRVTQIPTLFERHSQSFQSLAKMQSKSCKKKKPKLRRHDSGSTDSYASFGSNSRPNSGSLTSSSGSSLSMNQSSKSSSKSSDASGSHTSQKSITKSENSTSKKKGDRGPLKVSINETAELIEDNNVENQFYSDHSQSEEQEEIPHSDGNDTGGE